MKGLCMTWMPGFFLCFWISGMIEKALLFLCLVLFPTYVISEYIWLCKTVLKKRVSKCKSTVKLYRNYYERFRRALSRIDCFGLLSVSGNLLNLAIKWRRGQQLIFVIFNKADGLEACQLLICTSAVSIPSNILYTLCILDSEGLNMRIYERGEERTDTHLVLGVKRNVFFKGKCCLYHTYFGLPLEEMIMK